MVNDILKALQGMEAELQAIKSAKEQVEAVVEADALINENLKGYSISLSNLYKNIVEVKDGLNDVANTVYDNAGKFKTSLTESVEEIEKGSKRLSLLLDDFKNHTETIGINALSEKLKQVKMLCDKLSIDLEEVNSQLDSVGRDVTENLAQINTIKNDIDSSKKAIIDDLEVRELSITSKISESEETLKSDISSVTTTLSGQVHDMESKMNKSIVRGVQDLTKDIDTAKKNFGDLLSSTEKKLTVLSIVGIILLLVDIILHFVS